MKGVHPAERRRAGRQLEGEQAFEAPHRPPLPPDNPDGGGRQPPPTSPGERSQAGPSLRELGDLLAALCGPTTDPRLALLGGSAGSNRDRERRLLLPRPILGPGRQWRREAHAPGARVVERPGWSVRVRLTATSTAAARRRAQAAVVRLSARTGWRSWKRDHPLQVTAGAVRAEHLLIASDQPFESGVTAGAAVIVNGHRRSFAGEPGSVKRKGRSSAR
jgi:hypothetical protein